VAKGRRRQRRQFGWAVVVVGPGMIEPVAVPAGTVGGPRERWVEMQTELDELHVIPEMAIRA